jgi:hypothetical protein
VERVLGKKGTVTANYMYLRGDHQWISRNVNAPLPGTFVYGQPGSGVYPLGTTQAVYQFTSDGVMKTNNAWVQARVQPTKNVRAQAVYVYRGKNTDTGGATSFASNQYDASVDYGKAATSRSRIYSTASYEMPKGFSAYTFFSFQQGAPFNITTGTDLNGDTQYNDRPSFATGTSPAGSVMKTQYGTFDTTPQPGERIIPINYGHSPSYVYLELGAYKHFLFGPVAKTGAGSEGSKTDGGAKAKPRYDLSLSVEADNVINHVNPGVPVGVLSSPEFGESVTLNNPWGSNAAANRVIFLRTGLSF